MSHRVSLAVVGAHKILQICVGAIKTVLVDAKHVAEDSSNQQNQQQLAGNVRGVSDAVSKLTMALKVGDTAERGISAAFDSISQTTSSLDSAALFSTAGAVHLYISRIIGSYTVGQLEVEVESGKTVKDTQSSLFEWASKLGNCFQSLLAGAKGNRNQLSDCCQSVAEAVIQIGKDAKETAGLLTAQDKQQVRSHCFRGERVD